MVYTYIQRYVQVFLKFYTHVSNGKFFAEIESSEVLFAGSQIFFQQNDIKHTVGMDGNGVGTRTPKKR